MIDAAAHGTGEFAGGVAALDDVSGGESAEEALDGGEIASDDEADIDAALVGGDEGIGHGLAVPGVDGGADG